MTLALVGMLVLAHLALVLGPRRVLVVALLLGTGLVPVVLLGDGGEAYVGIANRAPVVTGYVAVLAASVVLLAPRLRRVDLMPVLPVVLVVPAAMLGHWPGDSMTASGLIQYSAGPAALLIGTVVGRTMARSTVLVTSAGIAILQTAVSAVGMLWQPLHVASGPQAADLAGRAIGTTNHPDQLGKVLVITLAVSLFFVLRPQGVPGWQRHLNRVALVASFAGLLMTVSRASLVAAMLLMITATSLGAASSRSRSLGTTVLVPLVVVAVGLGPVLQRFRDDSLGGARLQLFATAEQQLRQTPWTGVGPNHYVDVVGRWDVLTASGVPVHNAPLLAATELGLLGAAAWFLPIALVATGMWRRRRAVDSAARVGLGLVVALTVLGMTGWGLLAGPVLPLSLFVLGWLAGVAEAAESDTETCRTDPVVAQVHDGAVRRH